jgi:hypothetical protein
MNPQQAGGGGEANHEAGDEPVEGGIVEEPPLGQKEEVFAHERHLVAVEFDVEVAEIRV